MRTILILAALLLATLAVDLPAQGPISWAVTPGVTGGPPTWTRENPGAASATHMYKFGGRTGNSGGVVTNALWEFDGSTWTLKTAEGAVGSPPARDRAGVCWDFGRNVLVVFGGNDGATILGDTWEWDPITNTWTEIMVPGPSARQWTAIAWEPTGISGDVVLFGGLDVNGTHLNDTWSYLGGIGWFPQSPTNVPSVRRQHSMVTRQDFFDIFLCAGQDATLTAPAKWRTDAWTWNGFDWTLIPTANTPASVVANQAVYDPFRQRIVMTGGNGINGGSPTSEISEFDTVTNDWIVYGYATPGTADPVIGRISRYFAAFLPTTGKIYKISGQNPSGVGASAFTTCEYGAGVPAVYPGNGADVAIEVQKNGAVSPGAGGVHTFNTVDAMGFRLYSPGDALDGQPFALIAEIVSTGSAYGGLSLLPGDPLNVWFNPAAAFVVLDGLTPGSFFPATLASDGFSFGPFPVLIGSGLSFVMQIIATAPGFNPVNLGLSDAVELQIL